MDPTRETLVSIFCRRVAADGERVAMRVRRGNEFVPLSWNELADDVRRMAATLRELGVRPGDRVAQVSENRYEWIVCDLAVHLVRGVHVAVHSTLAGPQIANQIAHCGAKLAVLSNDEQVAKLDAASSELPAGLAYYSHDTCESTISGKPIEHLAARVSQTSADQGRELEHQALATVQPGDLATILYTSGTTGEPKGVMLSHGNLASNALASITAFSIERGDLRLCWLPLSHIFARTADLYVWIECGHEFALAGSRETILPDCAALHPTLMNGVPYFFDKVAKAVQAQRQAGNPANLRALLGGRIRLCCSGGAALPDHVAEFFEREGVLLVQGYGMTESSPVISVGSPSAHRIGTVGPPIPGVEVTIASDGEILTRGPHVMLGYWQDQAATAEVVRDGWLYTGDLGTLEDGFLRITGRKKELIVTAAGKNIAPTYLEGLLAEDPLIAQCVVIGDARNYLTALVVPERETLKAEILRRQIPVASPAEALVHPAVRQLYTDCINRRLAGVSASEHVRKFTLLSRGLTIEAGELTPTLKLRRAVIHEHFAAEIRALYEDDACP